MQQAFPQRLTKADTDAVKLTRRKLWTDDSTMQQIGLESSRPFRLQKMRSGYSNR